MIIFFPSRDCKKMMKHKNAIKFFSFGSKDMPKKKNIRHELVKWHDFPKL